MGTSDPRPQTASAFLPSAAYFSAGAGPACDALRRQLTAAGFIDVTGPSDGQRASEFWITPTGGTRTEISPPGTMPKKAYDLDSLITLVGTPPQPH
jgi:hypothetical protein